MISSKERADSGSVRPLDAVAGEIVHPRQHQRWREPEPGRDHEEPQSALADSERGEDDLGQLQDHERGGRISEREPHHMAAAHFGDELAETGRARSVVHGRT